MTATIDRTPSEMRGRSVLGRALARAWDETRKGSKAEQFTRLAFHAWRKDGNSAPLGGHLLMALTATSDTKAVTAIADAYAALKACENGHIDFYEEA